jgi:hypothetical protein
MALSRDPQSLSRVLLYGSPDTRRSLAESMRETGGAGAWAMLAATVRSAGPWLLRARCLEALGIAAAGADESTAELILAELFEGAGSS